MRLEQFNEFDRLHSGLEEEGLFRLDGMDFVDDPHASVLAFGRRLGSVVPQYGLGEVVDIRRKPDGHPNGPFGGGEFSLHIDGIYMNRPSYPDFVILACVTPSGSDGRPLFLDTKKFFERLRGEGHGDCLDRVLAARIAFAYPGSPDPGGDAYHLPFAPWITPSEQIYSGTVLHSDGALRLGQGMAHLSPDFQFVMDEARRRAFVMDGVTAGTVWVTANERVLHGREAFSSDNRHLLRVHVNRQALVTRSN